MFNNFFSPANVTINAGDTVTWVARTGGHDTVSRDGLWSSGLLPVNQTFSHTFNAAGSFGYFCTPHQSIGMVGTITVQGSAANQPPTVSLTAPSNGATFLTTDTITFSANASDDVSVSKVEFFSDGNLIGTDPSSPYSVTASLSAGTHSITAKATDGPGLSATSSAVSVTVSGANSPPTVTIASDQAGKVITAPGTVVLTATASDDGSVTQVEFFHGRTSDGVDTSPPYEATVSNLAAGIYSFSAAAKDNTGAIGTSTSIQVRVAAEPQITSITQNGATYTITASTTTGISHDLEATIDFTTWTTIATATTVGGAVTFTDTPSPSARFYRVVAR